MENTFQLNLVKIPTELKLILDIINEDNLEILQAQVVKKYKEINWSLYIELAHHHRVYPLLVAKMKQFTPGFFPNDVVQTLERDYQVNTFTMLKLTGEMERINRILADQQIKVLMLKGPVLAAELYGDISLRPSKDLDILVAGEDVEKTIQLLLEQGYEQTDSYLFDDWKWRANHLTLYHPDKHVEIEVHWRLHSVLGKEPNFDDLWSRHRKMVCSNTPINCLGLEDLFFYLVTHGSRHAWSRHRWLVDINRLMRKDLNWSMVSKLFEDFQKHHFCDQALILNSCLNRSTLSGDMELLIDGKKNKAAQRAIYYYENMVNIHEKQITHTSKLHQKHYKNYINSLKSKKQRLIELVTTFHPTWNDRNTLPLPKQLYFLYFILRPALAIWRKLGIPNIGRVEQ